jgi:hypothetical protein
MFLLAVVAVLVVGQMRQEQRIRLLCQQLQQATPQDTKPSAQLGQATLSEPTSQSEHRELLRLRGEMAVTRRELEELRAESPKLHESLAIAEQNSVKLTPIQEQEKKLGGAKLNFMSDWLGALKRFADEKGRFPASLDEARPYLPQGANQQEWETFGLKVDDYEIPTLARDAAAKPEDTIVLRETQPHQNSEGSWVRGYGFADGHSEVHCEQDWNGFATWEQKRGMTKRQ